MPDHPSDPDSDARARIGAALRRLGHTVVGHQVDPHDLDELATVLEAHIEHLSAGEPRQRSRHTFQRGSTWTPPADGEVFVTNHDDRPVSGRSSPYSLDPVIRRDGDEVVASVTLHAAHEGAPARSHGGIVAALFDDIFGFVLTIHQTPGFTGELRLRYEAGTPLHVPLECRVRLDRRDGRKLLMSGELTAPDGTVCARAWTVFITIDPAKIAWGDGV